MADSDRKKERVPEQPIIDLGKTPGRQTAQSNPDRPTKAALLAAVNRTVPDLIAKDLRVLFCGINPGLYSAWAGHHFARSGNRFWPALFASGFTERLLKPQEERALVLSGYGITNLVDRATVGSQELTREELVLGGRKFQRKIRNYKPAAVAILGVSAYRIAFNIAHAKVGRQLDLMEGAVVWVLPNPSGLNAHFTPNALARLFRQFRLQLGDGSKELSP